jgi:putative tryptophan/tyrosine transport system substrate-binding protein
MCNKFVCLALGALLFALGFLTPCSLLLAPCSSVQAQQPGKIYRIGFLDRSTASGNVVLLDVLRQELSKLGWVEGKNILIESRFADQKAERLSDLAAELVRLKVDVIVTGGSGPTHYAKQATATIPIVMGQDPDPVGNGLIADLARPGGNVTGLASLSSELATKRLEILRDAVAKLIRVGYLQTAERGLPRGTSTLKEIRAAAPALGMKLEEINVQFDAKGLENAFQSARQQQVGAIMISAAPPFFAERKRIVDLSGKYRLPAIYPQKEYVDVGGLMSYGTDFSDLFRRAAVHVDKILKGAKPADLPVEQPKKFEFIVNLRAAKQIGLTIPPNVLARADRVIK